MLPRHHEPIVAQATAAGRGAVGIVRLSGRQLLPLGRALTGLNLQPRHAHLATFNDAKGRMIDRGLAIHFPVPHSYTGEDVLELQAHGGPVVLRMLIARCLELGANRGLRLAQPGEFTLRAFLNGKIDLAQAEAVSDLIDASTDAAARSASRSLDGAFSRAIDALAAQLIELRALIEATLDFPEEEVETLKKHEVRKRVLDTVGGIDTTLRQARQGRLLRDGLTVVLAGQPNVGKSSLLNCLAGADLAIVTATPGTTRDRIAQTLQIDGVPVHVIDTAGLRDEASASDEVERIGMRRSWDAIRQADAVVFVHDITASGDVDNAQRDAHIEQSLRQRGVDVAARVIHVHNKADKAVAGALVKVGTETQELYLSALTGEGVDQLRQALLQRAGWSAQPEGTFMARARHVKALQEAKVHLMQAMPHTDVQAPALELLAEELKLAHQSLASITGDFTADDLLGSIFQRFCIGK
jgi:tRNA modification GTPase